MGSRDEDEGYYDALAGLPEEIGASEDYYYGYDDGRRTLENVSVRSYSSDNSDSSDSDYSSYSSYSGYSGGSGTSGGPDIFKLFFLPIAIFKLFLAIMRKNTIGKVIFYGILFIASTIFQSRVQQMYANEVEENLIYSVLAVMFIHLLLQAFLIVRLVTTLFIKLDAAWVLLLFMLVGTFAFEYFSVESPTYIIIYDEWLKLKNP